MLVTVLHLISYLDQVFYYFNETELKNINYINYFIETKSKFTIQKIIV